MNSECRNIESRRDKRLCPHCVGAAYDTATTMAGMAQTQQVAILKLHALNSREALASGEAGYVCAPATRMHT